MRSAVLIGFLLAIALPVATRARAADLVLNPGFDTLESYIGPWSTTTGVWKGDISQGVGAENGVMPIGSGMLKFVNTRWGLSYPNGGTGDLLQFIDLAPYASQIAGGQARIRYAARFNRVSDNGSGTVDTLFSVRLTARSGSLATFFDAASPQLAVGETTLITDGDVATWQEASGVLAIPAGATHLSFTVRAFENVVNDVANEFAGHYADATMVEFVPEPSAMALALTSAWGLACSTRSRRPRLDRIAPTR